MLTDRIRDHAGQGATTVAARRRRLRADRARQLADLLRRQVLTGGYPDGSLPHEAALGTDYRASRNTVRQALDLLRAEGLVERLPGVGTVVVARKYPHGLDRVPATTSAMTPDPMTPDPITSDPAAPSPLRHRATREVPHPGGPVPEDSGVLYPVLRLRLLAQLGPVRVRCLVSGSGRGRGRAG